MLIFLYGISMVEKSHGFFMRCFMSKKMTGFKLWPSVDAILDDRAFGSSRTEALEGLIIDGLRYRMLGHVKPIAKKFLDSRSGNGVVCLYCNFIDAINAELGLEPKFSSIRYRLEECPRGSKFYTEGEQGFLVLSENEELDGYGRIRRYID